MKATTKAIAFFATMWICMSGMLVQVFRPVLASFNAAGGSSLNTRSLGFGTLEHRKEPFAYPSSSSILAVRGGASSLALPNKALCWTVLFGAILLDVVCASLMKIAKEERSLPKLSFAYLGYFLSLSGFAFSLESIDVSVAYAVWAALGTALVSAAGTILFGEKCDSTKLCCIAMVIVGVIGLNLTEEH